MQGPVGANYVGILRQARISAEFAIANTTLLPTGTPPYYLDPVSAGAYWIEAVNEPERAWYCWTPGDPQFKPQGAYQVPTWLLGDIAPNSQASVLMAFQVAGAPMPKTDYRHSVIRASKDYGMDIFYNRHTSLKISHWLDTLLVDYGGYLGAPPGQYQEPPPEYVYASDVSVFFERDLDFGDAPDAPYPTLLANNGARHVVNPAVFMGMQIDSEPDGQPDPVAMGDDIANLPDEDGVVFMTAMTPGSGGSISVICSTSGFLSAWIDFNQNGSWSDPGETIFSVQSMSAGLNVLAFLVPASASVGPTFARFRFTTLQLPIGFSGQVDDGEVEDYVFTLYQPTSAVSIAITNLVCCVTNNTIALQWNGQSPVVYEPQYAEALSTNTVWTPCGEYVSAPPYTHGETMTTQRFFRVKTPYTMP